MKTIMSKLVIFAFVVCLQAQQMVTNYKRVVCYFNNEGSLRVPPYNFLPDDLDPFLCSDVIYSHASIQPTTFTLATTNFNDEVYYAQINQLKVTNPRLRTFLSVGGPSTPSSVWTQLISNDLARVNFGFTLMAYLRTNGFDGVDVNWAGVTANDKVNFAKLIQDINFVFSQEATTSQRKKLLISVMISGDATKLAFSYDFKLISDNAFFLNLMSINYENQGKTTLNSALRKPSNSPNDSSNQDYAIRQLVRNGADPVKINVGVPTFGRSYQLCNPLNPDVGSSTCGNGQPGLYTNNPGTLSVYEICQYLANGWTRDWSLDQLGPYSYFSNQWVSYDDADSLSYKVNFINMYGLGGVTVSDLSQDDFKGIACGRGLFPIAGTLNRMFNLPFYSGIAKVKTIETLPGQTLPPIFGLDPIVAPGIPGTQPPTTTSTQAPTTTTTTTVATTTVPDIPPPTTTPPSQTTGGPSTTRPRVPRPGVVDVTDPTFTCPPGNVIYADLYDCHKFYICSLGTLVPSGCPAGQNFDIDNQRCDLVSKVTC